MAASQQISLDAEENGHADVLSPRPGCDYALRLAEAGRFDGAPRVSPGASGAAAGALVIGLCTLLATLAPMLL
jgi:hypothetical protein